MTEKDHKNKRKGHYHPLSITQREIFHIFKKIGFVVAVGPEVETEYYNFDALNIPENHPARDLWDTFWLKENNVGELLRTHTSPVQIRHMETHKPPLAIVAPGKAYRYEATDATHEAQFYQIEGLMIGKDVSMGTLRSTLNYFFDEYFGDDMEIRFRPSYFPFVEPGVEIDMRKAGGFEDDSWLEIMGGGMVHPNVLKAVGIDSDEWQGFAFGGGIERLAMLKYGIPDVRMLHTGDLRVINQFNHED